METSMPTSAPKQKKGLKRLWAKVKSSMKADSLDGQASTGSAVQPTPQVEPPMFAESSTEPAILTQSSIQSANAETAKVMEIDQNTGFQNLSTATIEVDDGEVLPETNLLPVPAIRRSGQSEKENFDHAQAVYTKYGLSLDISDWRQPQSLAVERVEKKVRMRVRYTCHSCKNLFGRDKTCSTCSHNRTGCNECARYPVKRVGDKLKREKVSQPRAVIQPITTGICHECMSQFSIGADVCQNCEHTICERCLRETILASPRTAPPPTIDPTTTLVT